MNRPARFRTADLRRATKAAEAAGPEWGVEILSDGTIRVVRMRDRSFTKPVEPVEEVVF